MGAGPTGGRRAQPPRRGQRQSQYTAWRAAVLRVIKDQVKVTVLRVISDKRSSCKSDTCQCSALGECGRVNMKKRSHYIVHTKILVVLAQVLHAQNFPRKRRFVLNLYCDHMALEAITNSAG